MELQLLGLREFQTLAASGEFQRSHPLAEFRIVKLGAVDATKGTDSLSALRNLILQNENMYPAIDRWYSDKVVPGLKSGQRIAYVGFQRGFPMASAVLKRGRQAKLCHLKIDESLRGLDLGKLFFAQMAFDARDIAAEIHFTLPESLWSERAAFFRSFGFADALKARQQYRLGEVELACSAPLRTMWTRALDLVPDLCMGPAPRTPHHQLGGEE
jgi:hypothetical protein